MSDTVFSNESMSESILPQASDLNFEGLAPTYARTLIIEWLTICFVILAINLGVNFLISSEKLPSIFPWLIFPIAALAVSSFIWAPMMAKSRGFSLREHDIHYKSGIIWRKTVSLPFNRIQHVELESGPVERIFKLTTLKFFTAGGGKADMKIPALGFERASKLRSFVMEQAGVVENQDTSVAP